MWSCLGFQEEGKFRRCDLVWGGEVMELFVGTDLRTLLSMLTDGKDLEEIASVLVKMG